MSVTAEAVNHDHSRLSWAHPLVARWFLARFGSPTEPQLSGWPRIVRNESTLIAAPTGSGKTLAAFLAAIDRLFRKAAAGRLNDTIEVVYVSPLKALSNDVQKNLELPLSQIMELARNEGVAVQEIRTAVRTGDTLAIERQRMLRRPPHILVTTPESLYILLTAEKSRAALRNVSTVIVDEIHAIADDKRGAHLSLSLERLDHLCYEKPVRIGLSATQKPIDVVAKLLTGNNGDRAAIVDVGHFRRLDLAVELPTEELGAVASNDMWDQIYDRIAALVNQHQSTLIFVNTRKMSERLSLRLAERLGEEVVAAHHGSLSRHLRLEAERKLKAGQLKAIVATASLELGIDIGAIDLVCQIGSARSIAMALQRAGRAGHWRGAVPRARFFPTTRDELIECAAIIKAVREGDLDRLVIPKEPIDVLAQQIVAACTNCEWREDDLYDLVRRGFHYGNLSRQKFDAILEMLTEGVTGGRNRAGAHLMRDRLNGLVRARRGARIVAITNAGAIPETAQFSVVAEPGGETIGSLDEDFAVESNGGDIILLGNTSWRVIRLEARAGRMIVENAHGAPPTVPFWLGEGPSRTEELSFQVAAIRESVSAMVVDESKVDESKVDESRDDLSRFEKTGDDMIRPDCVRPGKIGLAETVCEKRGLPAARAWLKEFCGLDDYGAEQALKYISEGAQVLGAVPTQERVIAERFFDESGGMQLIIHAPFGARVNRAWGLALRKRFCRSFNFELQAAATDDGLNISLSEQHSFPLSDVFNFLNPDSVEEVLEQAVLQSPLFTTRFRWDATRALALLRFTNGKKVPPAIQRMRADDLLAGVFPQAAACQDNIDGDIELPEHPLIEEVMKDVLNEAMDVEGLKAVLTGIESGAIQTLSVDTPVPSVFSHEILNANPYAYLDDAPLEERRARAVDMRRILPADTLKEIGLLDQKAVAQVREEAAIDVRDRDEMHDLLLSQIAYPDNLVPAPWQNFLAELRQGGRAGRFQFKETVFWSACDRVDYVDAIFADRLWLDKIEAPPGCPAVDRYPLARLLSGWLSHLGPTSAQALSLIFNLPASEIEAALLYIESSGMILRGIFYKDDTANDDPDLDRRGSARDTAQPSIQFCDRRLLARIHRLTIQERRRAVEPVTAKQYMSWLAHWQHVAPGSKLAGERGALAVLSQLEGFEAAASSWESEILASRIARYEPDWLDKLSMIGAVGWGRLSPHPALIECNDGRGETEGASRRITPTKVAPISFFLREESDWMGLRKHASMPDTQLSPAAASVRGYLSDKGASFFADIVRGTSLLKSEVEAALWELVAAGVATADGFDNLRALIDPKRRSGSGRGRFARPRHSLGRWTLLRNEEAEREKALESMCLLLLRRYGVVFREVLARESIVPPWRELRLMYRRLEDQARIYGGRFIAGFAGEQFALPEAVESLRAFRTRGQSHERIVISAVDPLNLAGIVVPGERIPAVSGRRISLQDGAFSPEV